MPALTLLSKPGCHLCDDARQIVTSVVHGLDVEVTVDELSILDDPELRSRYAEEIPVVLIDGKVHSVWRVDPARLAAAITEAAR